MVESWGVWRNELVSVGLIDDVRGFSQVRMTTEGRESGLELAGDLYQCAWFRRDRYIRVEDHLTREGAARALGLEPEDLPCVGS
jgi:hypothetical protein